jgi:hypothetical protein
MIVKFIKVLTNKGYITLNRRHIISIDPIDGGARIAFIPFPNSEEPETVDALEAYEKVLEAYFAG